VTEHQPVPNGLFDERPWQDIPVPSLATVNQQPARWVLQWYEIGEELEAPKAGAGDTEYCATTIPECVHKLESQLPPNERRYLSDGSINPDRLIYDLESTTVYKMFAGGGAFGCLLVGEFRADPGCNVRLHFPVRVHQHGNGDTGAAYWRVISNNDGTEWHTFKRDFEDRRYHVAPLDVSVGTDGLVLYVLQVESHTIAGIDFFVSGVRWEYIDVPEPPPDPDPVDYAVVVNLLPQDATKAEFAHVLDATYADRESIVYSADDAARLVAPGKLPGSRVIAWAPERWGDTPPIWDWLGERGVGIVETRDFPGAEPPAGGDPQPGEPQEPQLPPFHPKRYVARGVVGGFHGAEGDQGQLNVAEALATAGVPMATAKLVVDQGAAAKLKALHPNIRIVGRNIDRIINGHKVNLEWFDGSDPISQAETRMALLQPYMLQYPAVDYWEIVNEQDPPGEAGHVQLARFFIRAMEIAETWGKRLACFSYSMGVPEPGEWDAMAETGVFERMAQGGHALALHEYGRLGEWSLIGRFRDVYDRIILPLRLNIPLFLTEYGVQRPDTHDRELVWQQFVEYERLCRAYPYVAGVHAYIGSASSDPDYYNAYTGIQGRFIDYAREVWRGNL